MREKIKLIIGREKGGLGVLDLDNMNKALLAKWLYHSNDPSDNSIWKAIILDKYNRNFNSSRICPFWKGITFTMNLVEIGINKKVTNGVTILFWLDRWKEESASHCVFPNLFRIVANSNSIVAEVFSSGTIQIQFIRQLTGIYLIEWQQLLALFSHFSLDSLQQDSICWRWTPLGTLIVLVA